MILEIGLFAFGFAAGMFVARRLNSAAKVAVAIGAATRADILWQARMEAYASETAEEAYERIGQLIPPEFR